MTQAKLFAPVYMQYLCVFLFFFTAILHINQCIAQMMNSYTVGVVLATVLIHLRQMQNPFLWTYWILFVAVMIFAMLL